MIERGSEQSILLGPPHIRNLIAREDLQNALGTKSRVLFSWESVAALGSRREGARSLNKFYELLLVVNCAEEQVLPTFTKIFTQKVGQECRLICGVDRARTCANSRPRQIYI